jgi:glutathione synthase/RimK-type ligase-like ATP-grasp enzyme
MLICGRIVKPVGQSRGRGIKMVRSARQLESSPGGFGTLDDALVVQRYVTNPMLVQVCLTSNIWIEGTGGSAVKF